VAIRRTPNTAYLLLCFPLGALLFLFLLYSMPRPIDITPDSDDENDNKEEKESKSKAIEGVAKKRLLRGAD
jgi:hypothetical protein